MKPSLISEIHGYIRRTLQRRGEITEEMKSALPGKSYPRMKQIALPLTPMSLELSTALRKRHSARNLTLQKTISVSQIGNLLGYSLAKVASDRARPYPSGGGLYPLETYLIVNAIEGLERGVYHYHPDNHALEYLWPTPADAQLSALVPAGPWVNFASCIIIFTCVWERSRKKYDDFTYLLSLIESGGAGQNLGLVGAALDVGVCSVAGFDEIQMQKVLDLPPGEQTLYTVVVGRENTQHES